MRCFLDMDGVIANWHKGVLETLKIPDPYTDVQNHGIYGLEKILNVPYDYIHGPLQYDFFRNLEPYPWMTALVSTLQENFDLFILTAPAKTDECLAAKRQWIRQHLPRLEDELIITKCKWAQAHYQTLLIDDKDKEVNKFKEKGGQTILFPQPWNSNFAYAKRPLEFTLEKLKEYK